MHVLDTFCYSGGFGISALLQGASAVDCVDSSAPALALAAKNGALNGVTDKLELIKSDVGDFLDESVRQGKLWDRIRPSSPRAARTSSGNYFLKVLYIVTLHMHTYKGADV
jgi:23S rRNA (cytosine1962-C5)-methyltransferase